MFLVWLILFHYVLAISSSWVGKGFKHPFCKKVSHGSSLFFVKIPLFVAIMSKPMTLSVKLMVVEVYAEYVVGFGMLFLLNLCLKNVAHEVFDEFPKGFL